MDLAVFLTNFLAIASLSLAIAIPITTHLYTKLIAISVGVRAPYEVFWFCAKDMKFMNFWEKLTILAVYLTVAILPIPVVYSVHGMDEYLYCELIACGLITYKFLHVYIRLSLASATETDPSYPYHYH